MKYICLGYYDKGKFEAMTESERNGMFDRCFEYDDHLRANGHWSGGEALQGPETALTLSWKNGKVATTDGPYAETKEHMGGFWILECADLEEALAWARKGAISCDAAGEVRELLFYPAPEQEPGGSK